MTLPLTALSVTGGELTHSVAPWSKRASVRWAAGFIGFSSEPPVPVLARNAIPVNVPASRILRAVIIQRRSHHTGTIVQLYRDRCSAVGGQALDEGITSRRRSGPA